MAHLYLGINIHHWDCVWYIDLFDLCIKLGVMTCTLVYGVCWSCPWWHYVHRQPNHGHKWWISLCADLWWANNLLPTRWGFAISCWPLRIKLTFLRMHAKSMAEMQFVDGHGGCGYFVPLISFSPQPIPPQNHNTKGFEELPFLCPKSCASICALEQPMKIQI